MADTPSTKVLVPLQTVGKLTVKDIGGAPAAVVGMEGADVRAFMGRFYGIARGIQIKQSRDRQTGETVTHKALTGVFRAVNAKGERFQSGVCYLPGGIHEVVLSPLEEAAEEGMQVDVPFGYDIYTKKSSAPSGYGYVGVVLGEDPNAVDPLAEALVKYEATPGAADVKQKTVEVSKPKDQKQLA